MDRQRLGTGESFEVVVAFDGAAAPDDLYSPKSFSLESIELPQVGISAAKNYAVGKCSGDVLIFVNDDIEPDADFVRQHLAAQRTGYDVVLGDTPFRVYPDALLLDECIAQTQMIFAYAMLRAECDYGFRTAWNLNLSIRADMIRNQPGPFAESFRPCMYEDLELAYRLMGDQKRVHFHPSARAVHDHRYTFESYLAREAMLGVTAPVLWRVNPQCFVAIFKLPLDKLVESARGAMCIDIVDAKRTLAELRLMARQPSRGADDRAIALFYRSHLPLKRRAFRCGLLAAVDQPQSLWQDRFMLANQSLDNDPVFSAISQSGASVRTANAPLAFAPAAAAS